jgi:hypothetical protein
VREALQTLNQDERALFRRMRAVDQRHALAVCDAARRSAPHDQILWTAALLHDVGKGRPSLGDRIALTLLEKLAPWLLIRWRLLPSDTWRGRQARLVAQTEASARFAELAGSDKAVVDALRAYGQREHPRGRLLAELDATR